MIRATFDVNVLASGIQDTPGVPAALIQAWLDEAFELVLSDHILAGLARTLQKSYFQRRMSQQTVGRALAELRAEAQIVRPNVDVVGVGEDREDDLVLSTAISGGADYLVTGDKHLQGIGDYRGVIILSPRAFLDVLEVELHRAQ